MGSHSKLTHTPVAVSCTAIDAAATHLSAQSVPSVVWNSDDMHYSDGGPLTVQYLFLLDALNFCFWPGEELAASKQDMNMANDSLAFLIA